MKFLILFFSLNLFAYVNYIPENKIGAFADQKHCETSASLKCYPVDSKADTSTMSIQDVEIDDTNKPPIYASKTNFVDCKLYEPVEGESLPVDDCRTYTMITNIGTEENPTYVYPLCTDMTYYAVYAFKKDFPDTFPDIKDDSMFAYCTKFLGYPKKTVKQLLPDQALIDAKAAEEAAKEAEKIAKEQEKQALLITMKACEMLDPNTAKAKDITNCIIPLIKYVKDHL